MNSIFVVLLTYGEYEDVKTTPVRAFAPEDKVEAEAFMKLQSEKVTHMQGRVAAVDALMTAWEKDHSCPPEDYSVCKSPEENDARRRQYEEWYKVREAERARLDQACGVDYTILPGGGQWDNHTYFMKEVPFGIEEMGGWERLRMGVTGMDEDDPDETFSVPIPTTQS